MERYAIIIKTDGVCVLLHCYHGDCLSLEEMQKIVEGHIQAVPTALAQGWSQEPGVGLALIVNEEGKLQNLPVNQTATDLSAAYNDVSRKDVRARRRICGVLAALCFLLLLGVVGGMENGTMALGIGTVRVMGTGVAGVLLTWAAGGFRYAARP